MKIAKVCASVSAETSADAVIKIQEASKVADLIEVRFDHLRDEELPVLLEYLRSNGAAKPLIATFRAPDQGGRGPASAQTRRCFWEKLGEGFWAVDLEEDIFDVRGEWATRILSFHDFESVRDNAEQVFDRLAVRQPAIIKYARFADDIVDTLPVWALLRQAEKNSQPIIAIAMGEAGKITRVLGPVYGSLWSYGSIGPETAPGQISADELTNLYRVPNLNRGTRVYGVIGDTVSRSLSPRIHNSAFMDAGLNSVFIPLTVKDLGQFIERMVRPGTREVDLNFCGFSVTMPHKLSIMGHLDEIDETAAAIGAVNTVSIEGGRLHGYNTDAEGFIAPLLSKLGSVKDSRAAVFGAGGAARACLFALKKHGANVTVFARDPAKADVLAKDFGVDSDTIGREDPGIFDIVVNATPVGMKGKAENDLPFAPARIEHSKLVYDLVTSAEPTPLIRAANNAGVETISGVEMLVAQAVRQFEVWTGEKAPFEIMKKAAEMPQ